MPARIVRKIAHACIFAHDLEETATFYREVLGIEKVLNFTRNDEVIGFYLDAGGETHIEVFQKSSAEFAETNAINHICLEVFDMDAAIAHVRSKGVAIKDKSMGVDDTWQSWTADPNGVKIELFQYTTKSAQFVGGDRVASW